MAKKKVFAVMLEACTLQAATADKIVIERVPHGAQPGDHHQDCGYSWHTLAVHADLAAAVAWVQANIAVQPGVFAPWGGDGPAWMAAIK